MIVLFGCGGHSRSVISVIRESGNEEILLVDENAAPGERILGCRTARKYRLRSSDRCLIAIGDDQKRKEAYESLGESGRERLYSICSRYALVREEVSIGRGVFVSADAYIGPQAVIGDNTIVNTSALIEHEARIGRHAHIAPNAVICGRSRIGDEVFCGASSTVTDKVSICDQVVIGAGAVVTHDITEPGIYVGVPARRIKR